MPIFKVKMTVKVVEYGRAYKPLYPYLFAEADSYAEAEELIDECLPDLFGATDQECELPQDGKGIEFSATDVAEFDAPVFYTKFFDSHYDALRQRYMNEPEGVFSSPIA